MSLIAEVSVPLKVDQLYSYRLPKNLGHESVGKRVVVNFANKVVTGLIVNVTDKEPDIELKNIYEVIDTEPIASKTFIDFCKWIADYYISTLGEVFFAAFPPKTFPKEELYIRLSNDYNENQLTKFKNSSKKRAELINLLTDTDNYISYSALKNKYNFNYTVKEFFDFKNSGFIDIKYEMENEYKPKMMLSVSPIYESELDDEYISRMRESYLTNAPKQTEAYDIICNHFLQEHGPILISSLNQSYNITHGIIKGLEKKGLIKKEEIEISRIKNNISKLSSNVEINHKLEDFQIEVLKSIRQDFIINKNVFLHGVTGSGKTLVYMHLIKDVISECKKAIMLLPEISLTPQLTDRFELSFPGRVCTIHSKLNKNERYEIWKRIANEEYDIVIGPRSAIFAPISNLGLIIVDEEHDSSYKQDSPAPRYNARDLATIRSHFYKCPVIFGTATPSLESYYNAKLGKYSYYKMDKRADSHQLPTIEIVDLTNSRKENGMRGSFSYTLIERIKSTLDSGLKVILFQNRRGFSNLVQCTSCGHIPQCKNCDISLTYHSYSDKLVCHYCGYTENFSSECNKCKSHDVHKIGLGTQKVEEEINEIFGENIKTVRYDSDTITSKNKQRKILQDFFDGKIDILIGTQMLAKGLNFSTIGLVGILNADSDLFMTDLRAAEKTYQLINQVAGRAGRTNQNDSYVVIQSSVPTNYAIKSIRQPLNIDFLEEELENRKELNYPPFSRFVVIELSSKDNYFLNMKSDYLYKILPKDIKELDILPPSEPNVVKIKNRYRKLIIIKNNKQLDPSGKVLRKYLNGCLEHFKKQKNLKDLTIKVNVDASSIM